MEDSVRLEFGGGGANRETSASERKRMEKMKIIQEKQKLEQERKEKALREHQERLEKSSAQRAAEHQRRAAQTRQRETSRQRAVHERRSAQEEADKWRRESLSAKMASAEEERAAASAQRRNDRPVYAFGSSTPRVLSYLDHLKLDQQVYDKKLHAEPLSKAELEALNSSHNSLFGSPGGASAHNNSGGGNRPRVAFGTVVREGAAASSGSPTAASRRSPSAGPSAIFNRLANSSSRSKSTTGVNQRIMTQSVHASSPLLKKTRTTANKENAMVQSFTAAASSPQPRTGSRNPRRSIQPTPRRLVETTTTTPSTLPSHSRKSTAPPPIGRIPEEEPMEWETATPATATPSSKPTAARSSSSSVTAAPRPSRLSTAKGAVTSAAAKKRDATPSSAKPLSPRTTRDTRHKAAGATASVTTAAAGERSSPPSSPDSKRLKSAEKSNVVVSETAAVVDEGVSHTDVPTLNEAVVAIEDVKSEHPSVEATAPQPPADTEEIAESRPAPLADEHPFPTDTQEHRQHTDQQGSEAAASLPTHTEVVNVESSETTVTTTSETTTAEAARTTDDEADTEVARTITFTTTTDQHDAHNGGDGRPPHVGDGDTVAPSAEPTTTNLLEVVDSTTTGEQQQTRSASPKTMQSEDAAKAAIAERRRLARVERERLLELQRVEEERLQKEEEERNRLEEEEFRRQEEEERRLFEEARRVEEERLRLAMHAEAERKADEERRAAEDAVRQQREDEERRVERERLERERLEQEQRLKREAEERDQRKARLSAIMARTRGGGAGVASVDTPSAGGTLDDVSTPAVAPSIMTTSASATPLTSSMAGGAMLSASASKALQRIAGNGGKASSLLSSVLRRHGSNPNVADQDENPASIGISPPASVEASRPPPHSESTPNRMTQSLFVGGAGGGRLNFDASSADEQHFNGSLLPNVDTSRTETEYRDADHSDASLTHEALIVTTTHKTNNNSATTDVLFSTDDDDSAPSKDEPASSSNHSSPLLANRLVSGATTADESDTAVWRQKQNLDDAVKLPGQTLNDDDYTDKSMSINNNALPDLVVGSPAQTRHTQQQQQSLINF